MASDPDGSDEPGVDPEEGDADPDSGVLDDAREPVATITRLRVLSVAALGSLLTGYVAIATLLAVVTAMASNSHFATSGVLVAALPAWLAAHQVPVSIFGIELGVLPLLPTIGVVAITARAAAGAAARLGLHSPRQAVPVVTTIAVAHGFAGLVIATLTSDAQATVDPLSAWWYPTVVSAIAATAGVCRRCGLFDAVAGRADAVAVAGLRVGAFAVVLLLVVGGAVLTFGLLTSISTARDLFPMGVGNALGMLLLSIGYLPNAMVAATAFVAGPGFSLGDVGVSPMALDAGPVPGLPLLAAVPEHQAVWWPLLFLFPLAVGGVVGRRLRDVDEDPVVRLRAVAVAVGVVAVAAALLTGIAGGDLGRGPFNPVSMNPIAVSIALVLWVGVPAAMLAWFGGPHAATGHLPGLIEEEPEQAEEIEAEDVEEIGEPENEEDEEEEAEPELPGPRDAVEESGEVARD